MNGEYTQKLEVLLYFLTLFHYVTFRLWNSFKLNSYDLKDEESNQKSWEKYRVDVWRDDLTFFFKHSTKNLYS
jgi:hypothetical protein